MAKSSFPQMFIFFFLFLHASCPNQCNYQSALMLSPNARLSHLQALRSLDRLIATRSLAPCTHEKSWGRSRYFLGPFCCLAFPPHTRWRWIKLMAKKPLAHNSMNHTGALSFSSGVKRSWDKGLQRSHGSLEKKSISPTRTWYQFHVSTFHQPQQQISLLLLKKENQINWGKQERTGKERKK
jgi:hypothetical protein